MPLATSLRRGLLAAAVLPLLATAAFAQNFQVTGTPDADGVYVQAGTHNDRPYYRVSGQDRYLFAEPRSSSMGGLFVDGSDLWLIGTDLTISTAETILYHMEASNATPPGGAYATVYGQAPSATVTGTALPVELVTFTATADGDGVRLAWATASETNNAGFHVEQATAGANGWRSVAFVAGRGTTAERQPYAFEARGLAPGTHWFRLRQVDLDGTAHLSPVVEATVRPDGAFALTAPRPNPTAVAARLTLVARDAQRVRVAAHDALGREVAVLHDGPVTAGASVGLVLDGGALPAGAYVVRVRGERFTTTVPVTVAR